MRKIINCIVKRLIKKYKTRDPYELIDNLDILLIEQPLGNNWGMYKYIKRTRVIFLNSDLSPQEKKLVLAHELGHAILHRETNCSYLAYKTFFLISKLENEANLFAAQLLIDDKTIKDYQGETLEYIALKEEIPLELLKFKASFNRQVIFI